MPSGKTHDVVTFLLAAPTYVAGYSFTLNTPLTVLLTGGFLFAGLMFGPDLDTVSKQNSRWGVLKYIWYPYQGFFSHRSRWSHGLIFGTFIRVIYFMGVVTLLVFLGIYCYAAYTGGDLPNILHLTKTWQPIGDMTRKYFGDFAMPTLFVGLWLGAASHTLTDMAGTFVKTGRITEFL